MDVTAWDGVKATGGKLTDASSTYPPPGPARDQIGAPPCGRALTSRSIVRTLRRRAVAQPGSVARSSMRLTNDARLDVPVTVVCTSLPSAVLQQMSETGAMPTELVSTRHVRYVDLPTGHWPMFSRPTDLAAVLVDEISNA